MASKNVPTEMEIVKQKLNILPDDVLEQIKKYIAKNPPPHLNLFDGLASITHRTWAPSTNTRHEHDEHEHEHALAIKHLA